MGEGQRGTLRLVVAAAGYGKTTALRRLHPHARWEHGGDLVELLAEAAAGTRADRLVVDDAPRPSAADERAVLDAVRRLPAGFDVVLASRWPWGHAAPQRWALAAPAQTRPEDLSLTADAVADLLEGEYGLTVPGIAERVWEATAGWPALVRLVAETLAADGVPAGPLLPVVTEPGGLVARYVAEEVLGPLPPDTVALLRAVAQLAPVTAGVCAAVGFPAADESIWALRRTGLLTRAGAEPETAPRVVPLIAAVAAHGCGPAPAQVLRDAAGWYRRHGPVRAAAYAYRRTGDVDALAEVLDSHGDRMLVTGRAGVIAELVEALPPARRTRRLRMLAGDALRIAGEVAAAARAYQAVSDAAPAWEPGIAWRAGLIHYLRGDQPRALAAFARGDEAPGTPADRALLLAWTAAARGRGGAAEAGVALARDACRLAEETLSTATGATAAPARPGGDAVAQAAGALATAHVSLALCLGLAGDPVGGEEHYRQALVIAERTGDLVLLARILLNQSYHLVEQARYPAAQEVARRAAEAADAAGHANLAALATGTEADMLTLRGRYEQAAQRYARVLRLHRRMGSRRAADTHLGLAELHLLRGWREQARAEFAEALRLADPAGSRKLAVRAQAGLAGVLLTDDPAAAARHAAEAMRLATDDVRPVALVAAGWVALAGGDRASAAAHADEALSLARTGGLRAGLARALELCACTVTDPEQARQALREAHAIWDGAGAAGHAGRTLHTLARLPNATAEDRLAARLAADTPTAPYLGPAGPTAPHPGRTDVLVRALGRFEVLIGGKPVPATAWQSRRARDLLRILVARRGRPVPRAELCELLWPDDDPAKTGHRLSVLLSIIRGVLDPGRLHPPDHHLITDAASVALDVGHLRVDVLDLLAAVAHGRRLLDRGATAEARVVLAAAVGERAADAFEDEPYADWAGPMREQARAAHVAALRMLARAHRDGGEVDAAVECLLWLLERDPYDEPAHRALVRTLVASGQHGAARRAFTRYRRAMRAIGVRGPDETILAPWTRGRPPSPASALVDRAAQ